MRTVTFSDKGVADFVNRNFVATWSNRNPKFHNCEFMTEKNIAEMSGEAYATRNFCTFFITPDQDVLHYLAGYYRPTWFTLEAQFALDAWKAGTGAARAELHEKHAKLHRDQEKRVKDEQAKKKPEPTSASPTVAMPLGGLQAMESASGGSSPEQEKFKRNAAALCEALTYLADLHGKLGGKHGEDKPPKLNDVLETYDAPNRFTEE